MKLTFYGGAKEVTGANYLLEAEGKKILVDCGLVQGEHSKDEQNFAPFPYDPKTIDVLFLTHAHADHVGRIPFLFKQGFRGKIICTAPTKDLALLVIEDSLRLLGGRIPGKEKECEMMCAKLKTIEGNFYLASYGEEIQIGKDVHARLLCSGHILGSAFVELRVKDRSILFTGDMGGGNSDLFDDPVYVEQADIVIMESVYGDRVRSEGAKRKEMLEDVIEDSAKRGGVLMMPTFAVERTQEILHDLDHLTSEGRVPRMPIFVDSPMAIAATAIFRTYPAFYKKAVQREMKKGKDMFTFKGLVFSNTVEESKRINDVPAPKIILAGSGMSEGGRILHHERRYLPDPKSALLFLGYQARGTRGRYLQEGGAHVTLFGDSIPVRCHRATIEGYSAHADQAELVNWVKPFRRSVKKVFLVQGEEKAAEALAFQLKDFLGVHVEIPSPGESLELEA